MDGRRKAPARVALAAGRARAGARRLRKYMAVFPLLHVVPCTTLACATFPRLVPHASGNHLFLRRWNSPRDAVELARRIAGKIEASTAWLKPAQCCTAGWIIFCRHHMRAIENCELDLYNFRSAALHTSNGGLHGHSIFSSFGLPLLSVGSRGDRATSADVCGASHGAL